MIALLLLHRALAADPCDLAASVTLLQSSGNKDAYLCVAEAEGGAAALCAALDGLTGPTDTLADARARYTRALTLWLIDHVDTTWDPAWVRRLSADDRRLLADGVYARRGRASPAPAHDQIFTNFAWYQPKPNYTDGRLSAADREKIAMADKPPPAPAPTVDLSGDPAIDPAGAEAPPAASSGIGGVCGCAAAPAPTAWLGVALAGVALARRRR